MMQSIPSEKKGFEEYTVGYILSVVPILLIMCLTCISDSCLQLLPLFIVEWTTIILVFASLCPRLGWKGIAMAALVFLTARVISLIVIHDSLLNFGAIWQWSDDYWYLQRAQDVVNILRDNGWNLFTSWSGFLNETDARWSLAGWPFLLGLVCSIFAQDQSLTTYHAIALSLNATSLTLVFVFLFFLLNKPEHRQHSMIFLIIFLALSIDPLVYAGMSRKESFLQLCLIILFCGLLKLNSKFKWKWASLSILAASGLATSRPAYLGIFIIISGIVLVQRLKISIFLKLILFSVIITLPTYKFFVQTDIRGETLIGLLSLHRLNAAPGLGMQIYNIPFVGPFIYYLLAPLPALPWKILDSPMPLITLIRNFGSLFYISAFFYIIYVISKSRQITRQLFRNNLSLYSIIIFCCLFLATVLYGNDPRYKQPTDFFLFMIWFNIWHYRYINKLSRFQKTLNYTTFNGCQTRNLRY